ncbi:hypothetical protein GOP47_0020033 [Adiantum capillus-veneris]|uniref:Uncharacterized protein n=1 Tax=Adiantum capillus-veneris TaxID=13818 RepID=A0A9D4UC76_ADICA|nr:hypothetical protein GOP47_0020033 [Adiantum capillus-veneris]
MEKVEPSTTPFQRKEKWKPVYAWLETLDTGSVVGTKVIDAWLENNPSLKEDLLGQHTRHHLFHYIQKCHTGLIKKKMKQGLNTPKTNIQGKKKKKKKKKSHKVPKLSGSAAVGATMLNKRLLTNLGHKRSMYEGRNMNSITTVNADVSEFTGSETNFFDRPPITSMDTAEARKRYEILSELQQQLLEHIAKIKEQISMDFIQGNEQLNGDTSRPGSSGATSVFPVDIDYTGHEDSDSRLRRRSRDGVRSQQENGLRLRPYADLKSVKKRKKGKDKFHDVVLSWSYSQVVPGSSRSNDDSYLDGGSPCEEGCLSEMATSLPPTKEANLLKITYSPIKCLQERERGAGIGSLLIPFQSFGKGRCYRWKSFMEGWDTLGKQFTGCAVSLERRTHSSWQPCWSAYTSSVAVAAPLGTIDQGVQKVLDVRFHPRNVPQLVCSSNAAPNELLIYDLLSGKALELAGHNCQIQAVEYAADGAYIVSCGSNLVKIWDSSNGACLHTLGPGPWDMNANGHKKKINALAVNHLYSCQVATSGGNGDSQILLWNVNSGDLTCDLNENLRTQSPSLPCMDALEFCEQNLLICGSDSSGGPAIVQIWDIQAPDIVASFPANDSYITSLKANPHGTTIVTGAGDGSVALFDIRTGGGIVRLPLGSSFEVTSVSFSSCATYLQASSTANRTFVWDTRMLSMEAGPRPICSPLQLADITSRKVRALHCLSHGTPMPTSQNAGQMPGFVDEGDQGVNDARWFHNKPILVTASGNGSIAMWDMLLGDPCIRHMISHTRCVNTVAISSDDQHICSGGDDQKVVLYQRTGDKSTLGWRLTHPLLEEPAIV